MAVDKSLLSGNTTMLLLKLLNEKDMYGYEIIETLRVRSNQTFELKAGTLYPLLHGLEQKGMVVSCDKHADSARVRKYYHITKKGKKLFTDKQAEWQSYESAVNLVLAGGLEYVAT